MVNQWFTAWRNCSTTVLTLVSIHSCSIELHNRMNESKHQTQCRTNIAFNLFPKGVINDMLYIINALGIDKKLSKNIGKLCSQHAWLNKFQTNCHYSMIKAYKSQLLFYEAKFFFSMYIMYTFGVLWFSLHKSIKNIVINQNISLCLKLNNWHYLKLNYCS